MTAMGGKPTLTLTLFPSVDQLAGEQSHWSGHGEGEQDNDNPPQSFTPMTLLVVKAVSIESEEHQNAKCRQTYDSAREAA